MLINDMIKRIEKKYPKRFISIEHSYDYHKNFFGGDIREIRETWHLHIEGLITTDYEKFEEMVNGINRVLNQEIKIKVIGEVDKDASEKSLEAFIEMSGGYKPVKPNSNYTGD